MTEILTESFCERCGTRYTFESNAAKRGRARGLRTLSAGLKNFVMSDETSLGDAMAAARSDQDREVTNQQLDAFHKTFNFCMQCRQYTCGNCWNEGDGFCLTCAPHLGHEILPAAFPTVGGHQSSVTEAERVGTSAEAWPALDLSPAAVDTEVFVKVAPAELEAADASAPVSWPVERVASEAAEQFISGEQFAEPPAEVTSDAAPESIAEAPWKDASALPVDVVDSDVEEPPSPSDEIAAAAASRTRSLLSRFRPGQNLDAEIAAFEQEITEAGTPAAEVPFELPVAAAPEPVAAAPEPVAAAPRPDDVVEQPVWRITAPDDSAIEPSPTNGKPTTLPATTDEPQWPTASADRLGFLRQPRAAADVWTASTQDLLAQAPTPLPGTIAAVAIQSCSSCGLSLSATARFCRRCGTRQA